MGGVDSVACEADERVAEAIEAPDATRAVRLCLASENESAKHLLQSQMLQWQAETGEVLVPAE